MTYAGECHSGHKLSEDDFSGELCPVCGDVLHPEEGHGEEAQPSEEPPHDHGGHH